MRLKVIGVVFLALVGALGGAWAVSANAAPEEQEYARYTNDRWHFTIPVPAEMTYAEYDGPGGTSQTIQFTDASTDKLFEVSATPYAQMDVALGIEAPPGSLTDQSTQLGIINVYRDDVLSFAFHRNGTSYTVTTLPGSEPWLLPILQSWEFTD